MKVCARAHRTLLASLAAVALVAAACGGDDDDGAATSTANVTDGSAPDSPSETTAEGGDLSLLLPEIRPTWDVRQTAAHLNIAQLAINEPLMSYGGDGSFSPLLAAEAEHPDPSTYIYTLRSGIEFSDGTPLTPADVKYSFELHTGEETTSLRARFFAGVESVEVVGDDQVEVTLSEPDPGFPYAVASMGIVSKSNYEAHPDEIGSPGAPQIGTGPYVIGDFAPSTSVTLQRNPEYWGEAPTYDTVTFTSASDDSSRLLSLQSGDFDGILLAPPNQVPAIEGLGTYTEYSAVDPTVYRVIFDMEKPPFDDIHVRKAIAHAIDRDAILEAAFGGRAQVAESVVPESVVADMGGSEDVASVFDDFAGEFEFDIEAARAELEQSSVPDGFSVEIPVWSNDPSQADIAQVMAQSLAELGIEVTIEQVDQNGWSAVYREGAGDGLYIDQWSSGSPDPATTPRALFTPGNIGNLSHLDDAAVNDALAAYLAADGDAATQQAALLDALAGAQALTPYVPLAFLEMHVFLNDTTTLNAVTPYFWMVPLDEAFAPA